MPVTCGSTRKKSMKDSSFGSFAPFSDSKPGKANTDHVIEPGKDQVLVELKEGSLMWQKSGRISKR